MKKRLAAATFFAAALAAMPAAAMAAPGSAKGPADGSCVATGVKTLGGPTIAAAANGSLLSSNVVDFVILDHAFNGADETEALLGITICE